MDKRSFVSLVGAGCAKDFISLRGLLCVQRADIILYDDLIDDELLEQASDKCELIYVGKRSGKHSMLQAEINALLVEKAGSGKYVVRLKGGDPFVFGRGGEEAQALLDNDIAYELVPGVSSAVAVPELLGIPVTHRGTAGAFTVITGHGGDGNAHDYRCYGKSEGTLVFLMGLHNSERIASELMDGGMSADMSAAIVAYGPAGKGYRLDCTVGTLAKTATQAQTPAIIVVGRVCGLHFKSDNRKSVLAVGSGAFTEKCHHYMLPYGIQVEKAVVFDLHKKTENIPDTFVEGALLTFTSARGVEVFFEHYISSGKDIRALSGLLFAGIGEGTLEALGKYGIVADICPEQYTSASLAEAVKTEFSGSDIYLLRSAKGTPVLYEELSNAGQNVRDIYIYDMENRSHAENYNCDFYAFGSAGAVKSFFEGGSQIGEGTVIAIGPVTAQALYEYIPERERVLVAGEATVAGISKVILQN